MFRGDEDDVLDRYYRAALHYQAEAVVRITADCPLIDPAVIDRVIDAFLEARSDYASNTPKSAVSPVNITRNSLKSELNNSKAA